MENYSGSVNYGIYYRVGVNSAQVSGEGYTEIVTSNTHDIFFTFVTNTDNFYTRDW